MPFQQRYAGLILELERINRDLNEYLIGVQQCCHEVCCARHSPVGNIVSRHLSCGLFFCHLAVNLSERVLLSFILCLVGSLGSETIGFVEQVFTGQNILPVAQQMASSQ